MITEKANNNGQDCTVHWPPGHGRHPQSWCPWPGRTCPWTAPCQGWLLSGSHEDCSSVTHKHTHCINMYNGRLRWKCKLGPSHCKRHHACAREVILCKAAYCVASFAYVWWRLQRMASLVYAWWCLQWVGPNLHFQQSCWLHVYWPLLVFPSHCSGQVL